MSDTSHRAKDLFSRHSSEYARFRPRYPEGLYEYLAARCQTKHLAWDCGTGNGQAAVGLARYFEKIIATDPSASQLANAQGHPRIQYEVAPAEAAPLENESADLVTVAQAFHWFDPSGFFSETKRVLRPGGVVAIWCYGLAQINPKVDAVVLKLYEDVLGNYWEPERKLVDEGYRNSEFPFEEFPAPTFKMELEWTLEQWIGYLSTWSALKTFKERNHADPLEDARAELEKSWGDPFIKRLVAWPLSLRAGHAR
jgi:SAM-dependent methyltransferase